MAGTSADSDELHYACKCLNVRIRPATTQLVATESVEDPDFTQVFVGEEGISVVSNDQTCAGIPFSLICYRVILKSRRGHGRGEHLLLEHQDVTDIRQLLAYYAAYWSIVSIKHTQRTSRERMDHFYRRKGGPNVISCRVRQDG